MAVLCSILLITVLLPSITADCQKCLSGFTSIGGSCYAPIVVKANRGDAIKECQKLRPEATLATVRSADNNAALHDLAVNKIRDQCSSFSSDPLKNSMWIGYWDDPADPVAKIWENAIKSDYRNWVSGQPHDDSGQEKGVAMVIHPNIPNNPDGLWFDLHSRDNVICGAMCELLKCDGSGSTSSSSSSSNGCFTHAKAQVADTCVGIYGFTDVGGSCYAPIYVDGTQADAKAQCKKLHPDADLASIRCEAENEGVWKLAQGPLKDRCAKHDPTNQYLNQLIIGKSVGAWIDGSNTSYSNWNAGEPNGGATQPVSTLFITNEGSQFPHAKWNDETDGKFCGAMCELFVGTSGSSCGLKPCTGLASAAAVPTTTAKPPHCAYSTYKLVGDKWCLTWYSRQTYAQGRAACQADGNDVLSIHSAEENALLQGYLTVDVMMGAFYDGSRWVWNDGTPFDYTNWAPGEPKWSPWMLFSKATGKWTTFSGNPYTSYYAICHGKPVN